MPASGRGSSTWGSRRDEKNNTAGANKRCSFLSVIVIHYLFSFSFRCRRGRAESRRRGHRVEQEQEDELEAHWRGQAVWKWPRPPLFCLHAEKFSNQTLKLLGLVCPSKFSVEHHWDTSSLKILRCDGGAIIHHSVLLLIACSCSVGFT